MIPHGPKPIYGGPVTEERRLEVRRRYGLEDDFILRVGLSRGAKDFETMSDILGRERARRFTWRGTTRLSRETFEQLGAPPHGIAINSGGVA